MEKQYLDLLTDVLEHGTLRKTRNATTKSVFFRTLTFDLRNNDIPLLTTKKVSFRNIFYELMWFLSGSTDTKDLSKHKVKIWDANSSREFLDSQGLDYPEGQLGPLYGHQIRNNGAKYNSDERGFDQLEYLQNLIRNDPNSRRMCMTAWAPSQLKEMSLAPCHCTVLQFYVEDGFLHCYTHQRSADLFLGVPYNITSYGLFLNLMAKTCDLKPGLLHYTFGDTHLYDNQFEAAKMQSKRKPGVNPKINVKVRRENVWEYTYKDIEILGYVPYTTPLPKVDMIA